MIDYKKMSFFVFFAIFCGNVFGMEEKEENKKVDLSDCLRIVIDYTVLQDKVLGRSIEISGEKYFSEKKKYPLEEGDSLQDCIKKAFKALRDIEGISIGDVTSIFLGVYYMPADHPEDEEKIDFSDFGLLEGLEYLTCVVHSNAYFNVKMDFLKNDFPKSLKQMDFSGRSRASCVKYLAKFSNKKVVKFDLKTSQYL